MKTVILFIYYYYYFLPVPGTEIVEFERIYIPKTKLPNWEKSEIGVCEKTAFSAHDTGFIEDSNLKRAANMCAFADFANKCIDFLFYFMLFSDWWGSSWESM